MEKRRREELEEGWREKVGREEESEGREMGEGEGERWGERVGERKEEENEV